MKLSCCGIETTKDYMRNHLTSKEDELLKKFSLYEGNEKDNFLFWGIEQNHIEKTIICPFCDE